MDITNIVSHLESQTGKRSLSPIADRLTSHADVNRDGNVSSAEFRDFLSKLTAAIDSATPADAGTVQQGHASAAVTPAVGPSVLPMPASTMNALRALAAALAKAR